MPDGAVSPPEAELAALDRLFSTLIRERISHGDLKGHNLFWQAHEQGGEWALIDLDAMRKHHSQASFARAYARDRARFLRNWPQDSGLYRLLEQRIPASATPPGLERQATTTPAAVDELNESRGCRSHSATASCFEEVLPWH